MKMVFWSALNFQNGINLYMSKIDWFHSYVMIFLVMILVLVIASLSFTLTSKTLDFYQIEFQKLEFMWTFSPSLILIFLGVPSLSLLYKSEWASTDPFLSVKVEAHQWYWSYSLSDFKELAFDSFMLPIDSLLTGSNRLLEVDNRLILPISSLIRFIITSADVLHCWAVPPMGIKVDANPGRLNQICSSSDFPQTVYGQCSEICGANHSFMPIVIEFTPMVSFKTFISLV